MTKCLKVMNGSICCRMERICCVGIETITTETDSIVSRERSFVAFKLRDSLWSLRYLQLKFCLFIDSTTFLSLAHTSASFPRAANASELKEMMKILTYKPNGQPSSSQSFLRRELKPCCQHPQFRLNLELLQILTAV